MTTLSSVTKKMRSIESTVAKIELEALLKMDIYLLLPNRMMPPEGTKSCTFLSCVF
ncbi:hypothetical protein OIU79_025892 [Salix purpurea]|uniref:Uncharacterized protein n=1 Tax=Salix purpurea TaxID=77065 RepID=A0A9Q0W6X9_SALPP|nr:hypothetical protein OIU79_025892 [Salix purpurea]